MKKLSTTQLRRLLCISALAVMLSACLAGCFNSDKKETEPESSVPPATIAPETSAPTTAPTTEATAAPTTEATTAPVTDATEAPTVNPGGADGETPTGSQMGTVTARTLNVRKGPGSNYDQVAKLKSGDRIEILETKGDWGRTKDGWVSMRYVRMDGSSEPEQPKDDYNDNNNDNHQASGKTGTITTDTLNVRKGPGTKYDKVDKVHKGDKVEILETKDGWARIDKGWISLKHVRTEGSQDSENHGVNSDVTTGSTATVNTGALNVRKGPGNKYDTVDKVHKGDKLEILEVKNGWARIDKGWVYTGYLTVSGGSHTGGSSNVTAGSTATVTASTLNIRKGPSTDYDKEGSYKKGDKVEVLEVKGNWARTDKGWISAKYLKVSGSASAASQVQVGSTVTVTSHALHIRKGPGASYAKVNHLDSGDKAEILEVKGNWGRIKGGWISLRYVKVDNSPKVGSTATVTAGALNVRSGAAATYEKLSTLKKGDKIEVLEVKNGWGRTVNGWVNLKYTKAENAPAENINKVTVGSTCTVTASTLNIRKDAGTQHTKVGKLKSGDKVEVLELKGNWGRIKDGWVSLSYLKPEKAPAVDNANKVTVGSTCTVTASALNIRKDAGTQHAKVGKLMSGDKVEVLEIKGNWGRIKDGWVSLSYLKPVTKVTFTAGTTYTVSASALNIRKDAGTDFDKVGKLMKGDKVEILEVKGNWGRMKSGWVCTDYLAA